MSLPRDHLNEFHGRWDDRNIAFTIMVIIKHIRFKCIECMNKRDEFYDVPTFYMKFLKYDPFDQNNELKAFTTFS
jgi:hypothetical protein